MVSYRRTRFVCVSDTHGYLPQEAGFSLPSGAVLIHAGDLTNTGTLRELQRTIQWINDANYEVKIVIAGNHDVTLDPEFYAQYGSRFHRKAENPAECIGVLKGANNSLLFLNHESTVVKLVHPEGPRTMFKVFGSPFSMFTGCWAFGYDTAEAGEQLWSQVPSDADLVVTHTPPFGLCDRHHRCQTDDVSSGCRQLLDALRRVRPILSICGHVHESRGYERVLWDGYSGAVTLTKEPLPPIDSKKLSLVDLTGKKQSAIKNAGSMNTFEKYGTQSIDELQLRRRETCVVNAAIMAKSWPHAGGKQFNRPIVVDVNLPVWDSNDL